MLQHLGFKVKNIRSFFYDVLFEGLCVVEIAHNKTLHEKKELVEQALADYYHDQPVKSKAHHHNMALEVAVYDEIKLLLRHENIILKLSLMGFFGLFMLTFLQYLIWGVSYASVIPMVFSIMMVAFISGYLFSEYRYIEMLKAQGGLCRYSRAAMIDFLKFIDSYEGYTHYGLDQASWNLLKYEAALMMKYPSVKASSR